ncbi:ion transporter [Schlegelella sp. S2-27]|uniref:Ion transporter n=1 Tax=Caldimonas mangrovi TaxID=2944811 RepID=A0ABT0YH82_9BURK|nr:ion transporter [Caldimonas mangrovi]MCM5678101.1 ion transporter [Caldimonas mangrovi]
MTTDTASPIPSDAEQFGKPLQGWRLRLYTIIFEADTRAGKLFDVVLIAAILLSVAVVMLDSVEALHQRHGRWFDVLEWCFTLLFTIEYIARLVCVRRPWRYARSFFGVIDLLAILPAYLAALVPELHLLMDVRILRLLRIFRVFKLTEYAIEYRLLSRALANSRRKILIFLSFVLMVVLVLGTLMYVVEGPEHGYANIPTSVYWAITTLTTVGFGDITPQTNAGRFIASLMMLLGWGTLAVPTGIVTAEMTSMRRRPVTTRTCHACLTEDQAADANYCRHCGAKLSPYQYDREEEQPVRR